MRETAFLHQNADRWRRLEALLDEPKGGDVDALAAAFVETTDDLAYARTFYPGGKTEAYLNTLTADVQRRLYRTRREERGRIKRFFAVEVPLAVYEARYHLLISLALFLVAVTIGVVSQLGDAQYARSFLGDGYVDMTIENIREGRPFDVYATEKPLPMFVTITVNNVKVALRMVAAGLFTPVVVGIMLFVNGIMLGTFHTLFAQHGLLGASFLAVWLHGTLELSMIVIAGGAGITLGSGWLFPGTLPRGVAFRRAARRALYLAITLVPILVVAGFIEGFVTRYYRMPLALNLLILAASAAYVVGYFVLLPRRRARQGLVLETIA